MRYMNITLVLTFITPSLVIVISKVIKRFHKFNERAKGDWDFLISSLVRNIDGTDV